MRKFLKPLLSCTALVAALPLAAENTIDANTPIHDVNGEAITLGHMILMYETLPEQYKSIPIDQLFEGIGDQLVRQTLLSQMLDEEDSQRTKISLENDRRLHRAQAALGKLIEENVTQEALKAAYDEKYANSPPKVEYNASHILIETEEEALNLIKRLNEGADFAELAMAHSTGPSGPNGGNLGWFGEGRMVPSFEKAVVEMEKEAISGPVKTDFGWHVIRLNDTRTIGAPAFEDAQASLREELEQKVVDERLDALLEGDGVFTFEYNNLDPNLMTNSDLLDDE